MIDTNPIYLILDNVRSVYNVGSIFRTADGTRIEKLFLCGYTPNPSSCDLHKTALGAVESVAWEYHPSITELLLMLRLKDVNIIAVEQNHSSGPYTSLDKGDFPVAFIIGNELRGVSEQAISLAHRSVEIPMYGKKKSLNAAVAAGIILYEAVRILKVT